MIHMLKANTVTIRSSAAVFGEKHKQTCKQTHKQSRVVAVSSSCVPSGSQRYCNVC